MTNLPAVYVPEQLRNVFLSESVTHSYADIGIVESVVVKFAEAELSVKSHKNAVDVQTYAYTPSGIETVHTRTIIAEGIYLSCIRTAKSSYIDIYFTSGLAANAACQIRTCGKEQVDIVGNIKTELHIDRNFQIELVDFHLTRCTGQIAYTHITAVVHGTFLREEQRRLQSNKVVERIFHTKTHTYSRFELGSVRAVTDI